jgi:anti-sigma factor RsiW
MKCDDVERLLADAVGEELSPSESAALEEHLAACPRCRSEIESLRGTLGLLKNLAAADPTNEHAAAIRPITVAIETRQADSFSARPTPLSRIGKLRSYRTAAGLAIAFLAGYGVRHLLTPNPESTSVVQVTDSGTMPGPEETDAASADSVRRAFLDARMRHAGGSDLARCLIALAGPRG